MSRNPHHHSTVPIGAVPIGALLLTVNFLLGSCTPTAPVDPPTKNFILISLDTLRADHLGFYGYPVDTTPFLDSLAERALVFDHAFAQYPNTLTSHMSMLTGLYPGQHGVYPPAGTLSAEIQTVAERFRDAGYRTAGHTEGGYMRGTFGFRRGFEDFDARDRTSNQQARKTFRRGLRFLDRVESEPFFLFLHTYSVHAPYEPPAKYKDQFWPDAPPQDAFFPDSKHLSKANKEKTPQSEEALAYYRALYDAGIRYLDDVLRDFFAELEQRGLIENTTIIITSDHGEEFREHGRFNHEQLYQEVLRVPLMVVSPAVKARRSQRITELVDVTPTLLEAARIETIDKLSGTSFARDLSGDSNYPKTYAYAEASRGRRSLYSLDSPSKGSKLESSPSLLHLLNFPKKPYGHTGQSVELYATSKDPYEQHSIAGETQVVEILSQKLAGLQHGLLATSEQGTLSEELRKTLEAMGYLQ